MKRYRCPCCGYYTLKAPPGSYDICPVCFWEDDSCQNENPLYDGGANRISLREARVNYQEFGASEIESIPFCRKPTDEDRGE